MPPRVRNSNMTYYNVFKGKFTKKADVPTDPDVVTRTNHLGNTVHEYHFDALDNMYLAKIEEVEHEEYGLSYDITCIDGNEYCKIRFSQGALATAFLTRMENIILDEPFSIELYYFPEEDKARLNVFQKGNKVEPVYTKDNPGALPPPRKIKINNKETWDWTDQLNYWSQVIKSINQHLPGVHREMAESAQSQSIQKPDGWEMDDAHKDTSPHRSYSNGGAMNTPSSSDDDIPF